MSGISEETIRLKCEQEPWCRQTANFVKFGTAPEWLENIADLMPNGSQEQNGYKEAAILAREIYRQQALQMLDPQNVEQLCQNEPWTTAPSVDRLDLGKFGFVTEKLERARDLFEESSAEYIAYDDAFEKAKIIYFKSMHDYARNYARGKDRAQIEEINTLLWHKAGIYEGDGTYKSARMVRLCELLADYQRSLNNAPVKDPSKAHYVIRAHGAYGTFKGGPA